MLAPSSLPCDQTGAVRASGACLAGQSGGCAYCSTGLSPTGLSAKVTRRYLTCQTCGDYFRTKAGAAAHLLSHPSHGPVR